MLKKTKMLSLTATIALLALTTLYIYQTRTVKALPANSMWTEPDTITLNVTTTPVGFRFNVTVYANLSVPSYSWQMYLTYNKNHLNVTGCWYSAGAKSQWAGDFVTIPVELSYGSHNATHNYVIFGECILGLGEVPPGFYSLAIVEFEVIDVPEEGIYQSQIRLDVVGAFDSFILDPDLNEIPLNFAGTDYLLIDEFTTITLIAALMLSTVSAVLLKNKLLKIKRFQQLKSA